MKLLKRCIFSIYFFINITIFIDIYRNQTRFLSCQSKLTRTALTKQVRGFSSKQRKAEASACA